MKILSWIFKILFGGGIFIFQCCLLTAHLRYLTLIMEKMEIGAEFHSGQTPVCGGRRAGIYS
jgi:hypothetical protein